MRVTLIDTLRAVSLLVTRTFGAAPTTKDIHEGFTRPCSYVQPILIQSEKNGRRFVLDRYTIQIIRLATKSETGYLELLQWQETLREVLEDPIAVYTEPTMENGNAVAPTATEFYLYPDDVSFDLDRDDMALVVSFTIENAQVEDDAEETAAELMQNLEIDLDTN